MILKKITWLDPCSPDATAVFNVNDLSAVHRPLQVVTMGWVLKEDAEGITIANEDVGGRDYRGLTFIIRSLIISEETLGKMRKKRLPKMSTIVPIPGTSD